MRIHEITAIKPIQPLTPANTKINALKQVKDRAADALSKERERQNRTNALKKALDAQLTLAKLN
jgi:hypothetical protein